VVVVRYEGPSGGPGHAGDAAPTAFLKGAGLGKGLRAGHRRPVLRRFLAASRSATSPPRPPRAGVIGLIEDGDRVVIDVHQRVLRVDLDDDVLAERRQKMDARERPWQPVDRVRSVSMALRAYAALATSADRGLCAGSRSCDRGGMTTCRKDHGA
jgi:dihydroxy-acid dehydratase